MQQVPSKTSQDTDLDPSGGVPRQYDVERLVVVLPDGRVRFLSRQIAEAEVLDR